MTIALTLGGIVFADFEIPDAINSGGEQLLVVHQLPGASLSLLDLNRPRTATGLTRPPRCLVTVNGTPLTGVLEIEVTNASHFSANTFRLTAASSLVKVRSWNQQQQKSFVVTYHVSQAFKSQRAGGLTQTYSFVVPNLSRDQALKLAQAKAEEITRNERVLTARLPDDNLLTTRSLVQLVGTNTAWDQNYYPDTVTRTLSVHGGYRMESRAKKHSTHSTVVLG